MEADSQAGRQTATQTDALIDILTDIQIQSDGHTCVYIYTHSN